MKKSIIIIVLLTTPILFLSTKCVKDYKNYIEVHNTKDFDILFIPTLAFNDDSIFFNKELLNSNNLTYTVKAESKVKLGSVPYCNQKFKTYIGLDTLDFYVLNKEKALRKDFFIYDSIVIQKLRISYNELVKNKCKIIFDKE
jgi:hypothetical protein